MFPDDNYDDGVKCMSHCTSVSHDIAFNGVAYFGNYTRLPDSWTEYFGLS